MRPNAGRVAYFLIFSLLGVCLALLSCCRICPWKHFLRLSGPLPSFSWTRPEKTGFGFLLRSARVKALRRRRRRYADESSPSSAAAAVASSRVAFSSARLRQARSAASRRRLSSAAARRRISVFILYFLCVCVTPPLGFLSLHVPRSSVRLLGLHIPCVLSLALTLCHRFQF